MVMVPYSASGARSIVSPTLDGMAQLCEWAKRSIAQAMIDIPALRGGHVSTWFHACQDFEDGRLTITLYWSIVGGGEADERRSTD